MQDIMFATMLYVVMICFVCCLRYQPTSTVTVATNSTDLPTDEPQPTDINQVFTTFPEMKPELTNTLIETETILHSPVRHYINDVPGTGNSQSTSLSTGNCGSDFGVTVRQAQGGDAAVELAETQSNAEFTVEASHLTVPDPSKLTLRQCRAVIREINKGLPKPDRIRQKINGKDAPADWLRGQIARYLETHPSIAMAVEEILKAG